MGTNWTEEQQAAIYTRDCNLLVSAAAGAGKTAVLVERIIRLLCDEEAPTDIDRLLVVTFTEAAAAEMRERIGVALEKEIADTGRPGLARQLSLLNGASISTLHSFCLEVIRRYFYLLDIDPAFRVADELEVSMLQQDILSELMEEAFGREEQDFLDLADRFGGKTGDEGLVRLILRLYRYSWSNPYPQGWLSDAAAAYIPNPGISAEAALGGWLIPIRQHLRQTLLGALSALERARKICRLPGGPLAYEPLLDAEAEKVLQLVSNADGPWEKIREDWLGLEFKRLPPARDVDEDLKDQAQNLRGRAKDDIKKCKESYFARTLEEYLAEVQSLAPVVTELTKLVQRFAAMYGEAKKKQGLVDFNDLEHFCLAILSAEATVPGELIPSAAALELRGRYDFVLVDEYQDINPVQDAILQLVSRQDSAVPNLFMVGDVKQSIYRFRLGDPNLFLARYSAFPAEAGGLEQKLLLSKNFRCRQGIVAAVNYIFRQLMTAEAAEIEYDGVAELVCAAHYPDDHNNREMSAAVELHLVERDGQELDAAPQAEVDEDLSALEREGAAAALRICALLEGDDAGVVYDKDLGCYRPLQYRDIVILLRATSNRADKLVDILARFNIPAYAETSSGYFAATEVETVVSLLKILDNPCQDIPLAAVLRSPLVGLDTEALATIRSGCGHKADFYAAVCMAAQAEIPGLSERLSAFLATLERWRDLARREKLASCIALLYRETGFGDYVAGLPNGAQRQANLRALFHRARQFDRFSRQGLHRFLDFIDQLRRQGQDLGTARSLGEKEDVVRIMSIHKSKGLEFPVVILADLGKQFNLTDQRSEMLVHRSLGLGPLIVEPSRRVRYPSLPHLALKLLGEAETRAEEMRILYVALTRAREKLILVGSVKNLAGEISSWEVLLDHPGEQLPSSELVRAKSFLDWVGRALIRHPDIATGYQTEGPWQEKAAARFVLHLYEPDQWQLPAAATAADNQEEGRKILSLSPLNKAVDPNTGTAIRERLTYRYPYPACDLPAKLSVSEIKRRFSAGEVSEESAQLLRSPWGKPEFLSKKSGPGPIERGTLYHLAMQHLDLAQPLDKAGIAAQLGELVQKQVLTAELATHLDPQKISRFFTCEAGEKMLENKHRIYREWPFTLSLPATELLPGQDQLSGESVVIQGIIDVLVETPEGYLIIDYKTDKIPTGGIEELRERYSQQINYYTLATETVLRQCVSATYLYFIENGQCLRVR